MPRRAPCLEENRVPLPPRRPASEWQVVERFPSGSVGVLRNARSSGSLDCARDFDSGLGRPLSTSTLRPRSVLAFDSAHGFWRTNGAKWWNLLLREANSPRISAKLRLGPSMSRAVRLRKCRASLSQPARPGQAGSLQLRVHIFQLSRPTCYWTSQRAIQVWTAQWPRTSPN